MKMKHNDSNSVIAQLKRIKHDLEVFCDPDSKAAFLVALDELISRLHAIRVQMQNSEPGRRLSEIGRPLDQVVSFLEYAKTDELLGVLLSDALASNNNGRPKRIPIEIPSDLKNNQIRELLSRDLSKAELKAIASQRGISVGKKSEKEVKADLLSALERQEGYQRLALPKSALD